MQLVCAGVLDDIGSAAARVAEAGIRLEDIDAHLLHGILRRAVGELAAKGRVRRAIVKQLIGPRCCAAQAERTGRIVVEWAHLSAWLDRRNHSKDQLGENQPSAATRRHYVHLLTAQPPAE